MAERVRIATFLVALGVVGGGLGWAMLDLPPVDATAADYGLRMIDIAVEQRQAANAVAAVLFDLRLMDTLGEVFALFAGAVSVQMLLREMEQEHTTTPDDRVGDRPVAATSDAMRIAAARLVAPAALIGIAIIVRGHLSVGGGFQGGVLVAAAAVLVYVAGRYRQMTRLLPHQVLDAGETVGAAGFAGVALVGVVVTGALGANYLPTGALGSLLSAGTIPVLSVLVGLEATAAVALIVAEYARQALQVEGDVE